MERKQRFSCRGVSRRVLSLALAFVMLLSLASGLPGTLTAKAAEPATIRVTDLVQVKVGDELTTLEQELPNVRNYNVAVHARGEDIVFLRKIVPGGADRSYGIEVAKLAGLPDTVLKRAREILRELESQPRQPHTPAAREDQVSLEGMAEGAVADIIRRTQVDALSPLEALNLLYELKSKLQ